MAAGNFFRRPAIWLQLGERIHSAGELFVHMDRGTAPVNGCLHGCCLGVLDVGFDDYLSKPFRQGQLQKVLVEHTRPEGWIDLPGGEAHVFHLYVVQTPKRDRLRAALHERGIGTDIHYPLPAHMQPVYSQYAPAGGLPVFR